jgi:hypothetical protein
MKGERKRKKRERVGERREREGRENFVFYSTFAFSLLSLSLFLIFCHSPILF